ncbi:uncharacterized protein LOC125658931 [Ostrea edulis]|uniref:uncharacterized protein LOC125658931 n=1 Tax=Ostrea edulis TaxID=37623 RepID=UPI0024AE987C|nr:uncharacterized protein LOC125658931 [Ostrea edulis]
MYMYIFVYIAFTVDISGSTIKRALRTLKEEKMRLLSLTLVLNIANIMCFVQKEQECFSKGSNRSDGLVYMCNSCVVTTDLGVDRWPRYITETLCQGPDFSCLNYHKNPNEDNPPANMPQHGSCYESFNHMTFYKHENATFRWTAYTQKIRGGCVCGFDKRSRFLKSFFYQSQLAWLHQS